jgi:hypothetical protein
MVNNSSEWEFIPIGLYVWTRDDVQGKVTLIQSGGKFITISGAEEDMWLSFKDDPYFSKVNEREESKDIMESLLNKKLILERKHWDTIFKEHLEDLFLIPLGYSVKSLLSKEKWSVSGKIMVEMGFPIYLIWVLSHNRIPLVNIINNISDTFDIKSKELWDTLTDSLPKLVAGSIYAIDM